MPHVGHVGFTQSRTIAKNVRCFQRRLFVCGFVCQHDNFRTSKHRMMKLGGTCIAQKSQPSSNFGVVAPPGCATPEIWHFAVTYGITQNVNKAMRSNETSHRTHRAHRTCVRLRRWENPRRLSSCYSYFLHLLQKSALMQDASNALHVLMLGAKMMFCVT